MVNKGVFKMKEMDNNNKELKESRLMEVTGGIAETDLVPANKEKNSEADSFKTVKCMRCKKEFKVPILPVFPDKEKIPPMSAAWRALHPEKYEKLEKLLEKCENYLCPECYKIKWQR